MEKKVSQVNPKVIPALYATKKDKFAPREGERVVMTGRAPVKEDVESRFGKRALIEDNFEYGVQYDQDEQNQYGNEDDQWGQEEQEGEGWNEQGDQDDQGERVSSGSVKLFSEEQLVEKEKETEFIPTKTFKKTSSTIIETLQPLTDKPPKQELDLQGGPEYSPSDLFMNRIKDIIEKNDLKQFKIYLQKIPLKNLSYEKTNKLLIILLKWLETNSFKDGLKHTLTYWSGMQTGFDEYFGDIFPIIPVLFLDPTIPFSALNYIMTSLDDVVTVEEIALDLFERGNGDQLKDALKKLFDIKGEPSGETYRLLYDEAANSSNESALEFFSGLQSYFTERVRKPEYVVQDEEELLDETVLLQIADQLADNIANQEIPYDDVESCVELLLKGFEKFNLDIIHLEKTKEYLRDKLENLSEEERIRYVYSFINQDSLNQLVENVNLFNIMGPSNPITNGDFTQTSHICYKYGGCRMFYCNCFEAEIFGPDNDDNEEPYYPNIPQWFTGKCQHCKRDIEKRCYAIRRPLPQGGWRGTYCSWNCLSLSGNGDDELTRDKIGIYEKELFEKTIMNRNEMNVEEQLKIAKEENPEGYVLNIPNIG